MSGRSQRRWLLVVAVLVVVGGAALATAIVRGRSASAAPESLVARLATELEAGRPDELERILALNAWIWSAVGANRPDRVSDLAEETLQLLGGSCGHREIVAREVASHFGMESRRVSFYGVPGQAGHSSIELFVDGEWRFIDPTFGLYFAYPDAPLEPVSLEQARASFPDVVVMQAQSAPWQSAWTPIGDLLEMLGSGDLYQPQIREWFPHPYLEDVEVTVTQTYIASELATLDQQKPDHFRHDLYLDLRAETTGSLGILDGAADDLATGMHDVSFGSAYHPHLYFIGAYQRRTGPIVNHRLAFMTDDERTVELVVSFASHVPESARRYLICQVDHAQATFAARHTRIETTWEGDAVALRFRAVPPVSVIQYGLTQSFALQGDKWLIDAISWSSATERAADHQ